MTVELFGGVGMRACRKVAVPEGAHQPAAGGATQPVSRLSPAYMGVNSHEARKPGVIIAASLPDRGLGIIDICPAEPRLVGACSAEPWLVGAFINGSPQTRAGTRSLLCRPDFCPSLSYIVFGHQPSDATARYDAILHRTVICIALLANSCYVHARDGALIAASRSSRGLLPGHTQPGRESVVISAAAYLAVVARIEFRRCRHVRARHHAYGRAVTLGRRAEQARGGKAYATYRCAYPRDFRNERAATSPSSSRPMT